MGLLSKKAQKRIRIYVLFLLAGIVILSFLPKPVKADYVTDYIGVRVGYPGKDLSDYVEVGDYHISEIEAALPIYEYAYSFFQPNKLDPSKYTYIVDSARGFLVKDLLDYANIYYGHIYNLNFYVQDHNGMWCAFDRDSLFAGDRYYFNDLPGHRKINYKTYPKSKTGSRSMYALLAAGGIEPVRIGSDPDVLENLSMQEIAVKKLEEPSGEELLEKEPSEEEPSEEEPSEEEPSEEEPSEEEPSEEVPSEEEPSEEEPSEEEPSEEEPSEEEPSEEEPSEEEPSEEEPSEEEPSEEEPSEEEPSEEDVETDYSVILGYDFSECWSDYSAVPPILAIEDNWASFNEEFETAGPDFTSMSTGSRFRLLYGQKSPTDSNTRDSAKYVRYVYVTLTGSPKIVEPSQKKKIEKKVGATGTVEFEVDDVYNEEMLEQLAEYVQTFSTDEEVLQITGVTVRKKSDVYSDQAIVEVSYKVVGEGDADIGATMGSYHGNPDEEGVIRLTGSDDGSGGDGPGDQSDKPPGDGEGPDDPDKKEGSDPGEGDDPEKETEPKKEEQTEKEEEEAPTDQEKESRDPGKAPEPGTVSGEENVPDPGQESKERGASEQPAETEKKREALKNEAENENSIPVKTEPELDPADKKVAEAEIDAAEIKKSKTMVYQLSDDLRAKLDSLQEIKPEELIVPETEELQQLELEDHSKEKEERRRIILLWTGAGCLAVCVIGGFAEYVSFRFRLKKRLRKQI